MKMTFETLETRETPAALWTPIVPVELWQDLAASVRVLVEGTTAPSPESVQTLITTVQSATADGTITPRETVAITNSVQTVLQEANIPPEELQAVIEDLQAIYQVIQTR